MCREVSAGKWVGIKWYRPSWAIVKSLNFKSDGKPGESFEQRSNAIRFTFLKVHFIEYDLHAITCTHLCVELSEL